MGELVKYGSPAEKLSGYPAEKLTGLVWFDVIDRQWSSTSPFRVTTYTVLHCILNIFFCFFVMKKYNIHERASKIGHNHQKWLVNGPCENRHYVILTILCTFGGEN